MGVSLDREVKAQLEAAIAALKPQVFMLDGAITNVGASGSVPMMGPSGMMITLPAGFVQSISLSLKAQRDFSEKILNLVELMYQKMVD